MGALFVLLLLFSLYHASRQACTVRIVDTSGFAPNSVFECEFSDCVGSSVTWRRNGLVVTAVEEANISGDTVTFDSQDLSREARWTCEVDGIISEPLYFLCEL